MFSRVLRLTGYFLLSWALVSGCALISPPISPLEQTPSQTIAKHPAQVSPDVNPEILAEQGMESLANPGPWQDVTQLISYGDRLWFANSVTGQNYNAADIYSYDPATKETRYERHLFSQSAGKPVVADGLLYWPFEDPRFSADLGEYMVTNGEQWQWRVLPEGEDFHIHTMAAMPNGTLYAGTGAWAGRLQQSSDKGGTWQVVYTHPTPEKQVSRLTELAGLNEQLYAGITALHSDKVKLLKWQNDTLTAVETWPTGRRVKDLVAYGGWLYGINEDADRLVSLWRTDGEVSEPVVALDGHRVQAIAAGEDALWAVSISDVGRFLWRSEDGVVWDAAYEFEGMRPLDVAVHRGQVYVGGRDDENRGVLWGPERLPDVAGDAISAPQMALWPGSDLPSAQQMIQQIDDALSDTKTYQQGDTQAGLVKAFLPLALSQTAEAGEILSGYFSDQLNESLAVETAVLFDGAVEESALEVTQWYLLWAMGLNGQGQVPVAWLAEPWSTPQNDREEYWQPAPAAIWTVGEIGQNDTQTIETLIVRLTQADDPLWLTGDVVGALTALTGERLGYDAAAWQAWWADEGEAQQ